MNIIENHLNDLRSSGLNESTLAMACIRSGSKDEIQDVLCMKIPGALGGLIFPYFNLNGTPIVETIYKEASHPYTFSSDARENRLIQVALRQFTAALRKIGALAVPVILPEIEAVSAS